MSGEWHSARAALEAAVVTAVKRFEDETGCRLAIEIRYENPAEPKVTVNVAHVLGVGGAEGLVAALNDAVRNKDVQLTATNTKTGSR
jgi:hypothetical protein